MKLITHKSNRDAHWAQIDLTCLEDPGLSPLAKCVHIYAMTRPSDWELWQEDMARRLRVSTRSIQRAMKELERAGYLRRRQENIRGQYQVLELALYDLPQTVHKVEHEPGDKNRHTANRHTADGVHSNNQSTNDQGNKNQERVRVEGYSGEFRDFLAAYPVADMPRALWFLWNERLNDGVTPEEMVRAARNYAAYVKASRMPKSHRTSPNAFLSDARHIRDWQTEKEVEEDDDRYIRPRGAIQGKAGRVSGGAPADRGRAAPGTLQANRELYGQAVLRGGEAR